MNSFTDLCFDDLNTKFDVGCWEFMKEKPQLYNSQHKHTFNELLKVFKKVYNSIRNVKMQMEEDKKDDEALNGLTVEDAILILMYANKDKPITGRLMFVKQIFLLSKEVIPQLDEKLKFFPAHFGPFSKVFASEIDRLISEGYIETENNIDNLGNIIHRYSLTDNGKERALISFSKLSDNYKNLIIRKRKGWDQLGYTGIVRFVYAKYPEYAVYSKIKNEVENGY